MTRVVITGIGIVSPLGIGREQFWSSLVAGRSGIGPISLFDASSFPVRFGGEVKGFDCGQVVESFPEVAADRDRKVFLALAAAKQAVADAALTHSALRDGLLCVGIGLESLCLADLTAHAKTEDFDQSLAHAMLTEYHGQLLQTPLDRTATVLGGRYGFLVGRYTNCSACAAGTQVIGEAWQMLCEGQAAVALAGAADSMLNPLGLGGFSLLRVLSEENDRPQQACRPFDATRQGTVLGEGAAFLVLETLEHAAARRAFIYAELSGYGSSLDAFAVSDPDPSGRGAVQSMRRAIRAANLEPSQIDCVNAHATGTPKNDAVETAAIKEVLGSRAYQIPVHAVKSMTGHLIAASGAVEASAAALCISRRTVPPTINLQVPDPACDLDYVPGEARPLVGDVVLSNSFGFGGQNATVILGRFPPPTRIATATQSR
jgi:3-oxoacyl-[acyl-carrier-protein] synthase II